MNATFSRFGILILFLPILACSQPNTKNKKYSSSKVTTQIGEIELAAPFATPSVSNSNKMVPWPKDQFPIAPKGFIVTQFAKDLAHPRNTFVAPNGDIFVAESNTKNSANRIRIFRDKDKDGNYETNEIYLKNLNKPYGILVLQDYFYVANSDGLYRYAYDKNALKMANSGEKIVDLPAGGYNHHWTRNLIASLDGKKIYISVGSASNVGEYGMQTENRRACILEIDPDGKNEKVYGWGIRNPVGMDWNPITQELWTAVNERDGLGDDLVPDYLTSVKPNGFYGWPYTYFGEIIDPRWEGKIPKNLPKSIVPDVSLGSHTASLGLTFYTSNQFPEKYKNGAFIGQHGSWNSSTLTGYKVVFVPFENGKPVGPPEDFLTGFIANSDASQVYGRPVDVTVLPDGSLLVNDDSGNCIWKVSYKP